MGLQVRDESTEKTTYLAVAGRLCVEQERG